MSIYLSRTEEDLQTVINKTLPALCQVDSIKLKHQPHSKKSKHTYNYSFVYNNKIYSFLFSPKIFFVQETKKQTATKGSYVWVSK